ncbi:MAG: cyclase family protein [Pyrinomonadaceae bacterium]
MSAPIQINGIQYEIDIDNQIDISIPLNFNGPQPNAYGVERALSKACKYGDLVGDTRRGGSCNFEQYTFITHCSGTHTECVGHITHERISVRDCLRDVFIPAVLVSVSPEWTGSSDDLVISADSIAAALSEPRALATGLLSTQPPAAAGGSDKALIVRTLPNDDSKLTREYGDVIPPYISTDAMRYIVDCGFKHLLVDMPSVDRVFDEGKLSNHRIFWNVDEGSFEINEETRLNSTITELIYVPIDVEDGEYFLNLQIAPFAADASPSRPLLFKLI